jgi:hypothetical protein
MIAQNSRCTGPGLTEQSSSEVYRLGLTGYGQIDKPCQQIRERGINTPGLILIADNKVLSKINLLDVGADSSSRYRCQKSNFTLVI